MSEPSHYGICEKCNQPNTYYYKWCPKCNAKRFQQNFKNWTSGNDDMDKFIQRTQLSAMDNGKLLEWIPYDRFYNIKYIAKGGFGNVYKANWIDGYIRYWNDENKNWYRCLQNGFFALKSLNNSKNVTLEFINEITSHHKLCDRNYIIKIYRLTQDPETKNYMMVLDYTDKGNLRNYLNTNKSGWYDKIRDLYCITVGLNAIHNGDLIHRNLHTCNVLKVCNTSRITDVGLCKPANYNNTKKSIYGVLPFVAPEILRGQNYTKDCDIYSFGMIMYEVISGLPPHYDVSHDISLAIKICNGLRPRFNIKVPQLIMNLIKRCLDANPLNRPTAYKLHEILWQWCSESYKKERTEIKKQVEDADEINNSVQNSNLSNLSSPTSRLELSHNEAIYTSRLLDFDNLPEPKNSGDYYEQYDNIISTEFSESLNHAGILLGNS